MFSHPVNPADSVILSKIVLGLRRGFLFAVAQAAGVDACSGATPYFVGQTNVLTDATGTFTFSGLSEGVYEVIPVPSTVSPYTTAAPAGGMYLTVGSGDIETLAFVIS